MNKLKTFILSSSTVLLLAACGTETTMEPIEEGSMDNTEEQVTEGTTEESAETTSNDGSDNSATDDETHDSTTATKGNAEKTSSRGIENREFEITLADAVAIFNETFPEAEGINNVQFDVDDGRFEYEFDGFSLDAEYELTIDAETGAIIDQETDSEDDNDEVAINFEQIISPQEAMNQALTETSRGYVKEWELETDDGRTYYEVDIEDTDHEEDDIDVDALTGEIL